ncbi:MAG: sterol desaturase family protein [Pyrinomonadaceae bacterium]|nr:sterol desaturase family protein [Sphingobacteriaceae bacterium]
MISVFEIFLNPVTQCILALYAFLLIWEFVFPGRELPVVKGWRLRGIAVFLLYLYLSSYLPLLWDKYLAKFQLINLSHLALWQSVVIAILVYEFGMWGWHWSMHQSDFLWRVFHQMHHSAERLDAYGAFYFSPADIFGWTLLGSLCFTFITGLSPEAVTIALLITTFLSIFQHANIKTPQWLGYIIQRPESHTVHHAKGIHAYNYSDLPLFDIIFGTFRNPKGFEHETGFYDGASARITDMVLFKDINAETETNFANLKSTTGHE